MYVDRFKINELIKDCKILNGHLFYKLNSLDYPSTIHGRASHPPEIEEPGRKLDRLIYNWIDG